MSKPANVVCEGDVCYYVPEPGAVPGAVPESAGAPDAAAAPAWGIAALLGSKLQGRDGKLSTVSVTGKGKVIALYFSAHWCPPCRGFTPRLADIYKDFKKSHARAADFEVVFVSSDRDHESFDAYYAEMPWLALPYSERDLKMKLSSKFKVKGIPCLVLLDGDDGSLITLNGKDAILADPSGANFPWRPKSAIELLSINLVDKTGALHDGVAALAGKTKLLYYSAHWCPPCQAFTPVLGETYEKLKAAGKNVECVYISADRSEEDFTTYLGEQAAWLAVPFEDKETKAALNTLFDVDGIPTLVVLDEDGKLITTNGRAAVGGDPDGTEFPWRPKPVSLLGPMTASYLNDGPVLLLALDDVSTPEAAAARAENVLGAVARAVAASEGDVTFLFATRGDALLAQVLEFCKLPPLVARKEAIVLLDVPSQCLYNMPDDLAPGSEGGLFPSATLSATAVKAFVTRYHADSLQKVPLS